MLALEVHARVRFDPFDASRNPVRVCRQHPMLHQLLPKDIRLTWSMSTVVSTPGPFVSLVSFPNSF